MSKLNRAVGEVQMAIGAVHTLVGLLVFRKQIVAIGRDRIVNTVDRHPDRQLAFWFLLCGPLIIANGQLARWTQRRTGALPPAYGWNNLAVGVAGAVLMPASGFWLIIPQGLLAIVASRRAAR